MIAKSVTVVIALLVAGVAIGETRAEYRAREERLFAIEDRIEATRPYNRVSPSRSVNIRDEEVREIKSVVSEILPGAIVNISTVVTGCECEDGPSCSDQVWVLAYRAGGSQGLLLSKMDDHWKIGPVQQWWLDYEKFQARRFPTSGAYYDAEDAFKERFPACLEKPRLRKVQ